MLKACPSKSQTVEIPSESEVANNLIYELLTALIAKPIEVPEEGNMFSSIVRFYIHILKLSCSVSAVIPKI